MLNHFLRATTAGQQVAAIIAHGCKGTISCLYEGHIERNARIVLNKHMILYDAILVGTGYGP